MPEYRRMHPNVHFVAMFDVNNDDPFNYDVIIDKDNGTYTEYTRREAHAEEGLLYLNGSAS